MMVTKEDALRILHELYRGIIYMTPYSCKIIRRNE